MTLSHCPFCGGEGAPAKVRYSRETVNEQGWKQSEFHYVSCVSCGACNLGIVGHATPELAAERWNTRAPAPAPVIVTPYGMIGDRPRKLHDCD